MTVGEALLVLGKVLFAAAGVVTGVQVLRMSRESGTWGLHTLAVAALVAGGLGLVALPLGRGLGPGPGGGLVLGGEILMRLALAGLWVFLWRVFLPGSRAGALLAAAGIVLLVVVGAWDVGAQPGLTEHDDALASAHAAQASIALPFLASALLCGHAHRSARRRRRLGLCDAMTCERFRLWAVATGLLVAVCALAVAVGVADAAGRPALADALRGLRGLAYVPIAGCVWLGMAPPAWFRTRIENSAGAA